MLAYLRDVSATIIIIKRRTLHETENVIITGCYAYEGLWHPKVHVTMCV